jgi:DNA-binding transcriptional MerR regulator
MLTVSQLASRCRLSRTAVLYYESAGLLKPASRTGAQYRVFGEKEVHTLEQICLYRSVGLSVKDIAAILGTTKSDAAAVLQQRLVDLEREIEELRGHQRKILQLLKNKNVSRRSKAMTKEKWVTIMKSAGFTEADMHRWHSEFERSAPEDHEKFLAFLNIPKDEITLIRQLSRKENNK